MAFKILRRGHAQAGGIVCAPDELGLRLAAGLGDAGRLAIGIDASRADDGSDGISILQGVGEPLDDDAGNSLSSAIAVGSIIKGV